MKQTKPIFHSIDKMPLLEEGVNGMLEASQEQLEGLMEAVDRPHVLDNAIIKRILKAFTEQREYIILYEQQFNLWQNEQLNSLQQHHLKSLQEKLQQIKILNEKILKLAEQFKSRTIEEIMEMDDFALALDFLSKK